MFFPHTYLLYTLLGRILFTVLFVMIFYKCNTFIKLIKHTLVFFIVSLLFSGFVYFIAYQISIKDTSIISNGVPYLDLNITTLISLVIAAYLIILAFIKICSRNLSRNKIIQSGDYLPSYMWNTNGWLCEKLGLTIKSQTQVTVPTTNKEDIYSSTLGMTVKAGDATGMSAVVTTETEEGITIESECIGKVYSKEDYDKNEWTVYGEPNTTITVARPSTVELTCATIVNRIPDVINAQPGYVTTDKLGDLQFKLKI